MPQRQRWNCWKAPSGTAARCRRSDEQDGVLYLTAAMTGLRQGELLALR